MKKKLPIGISTLEDIIYDNYSYVDKTQTVARLINTGKYYFLSRPRRFGKSLLLDTLKQVFLGNKKLFAGLFIENNWDFDVVYPVVHISFGAGELRSYEQLDLNINSLLQSNARQYGVELTESLVSNKFKELIVKLENKYTQKVVILIDEYDKPMLDNLTDKELCIKMRSGLKDLYSTIKDCDAYIKFAILTGVSKFSKISLFSGLNNLNDITLNSNYADICGYTQSELESIFTDYLADGAVDLVKLKQWYNGYNFGGKISQKVYNPFDILLFFDNNYTYKSYWFETGSPSFLIKLVEEKKYFIPDLESVKIREKDLSAFDVDVIPIPALLFQTGYLTIKTIDTVGTQFGYLLSYPNLEVKASLNDSLATIATTAENKTNAIVMLDAILKSNNLDGLAAVFSGHFAGIPHDWYRNNNIANYEGFYSSVVYSYFCALGYEVIAEDTTNHGKIDLTIITLEKVLILEFKINKYGTAKEALEQIRSKNYAQKYILRDLPIYLVGMSFDTQSKNMADLQWEIN